MEPRPDLVPRRFPRASPMPRSARVARPPGKPFQFRSDPSNPPDCTDFDSATSLMACETQYLIIVIITNCTKFSIYILLMRTLYSVSVCVNIIKLNFLLDIYDRS